MTRTALVIALTSPLIAFVTGCGTQQTSVELVNNTSHTVDVQLFYHEEQNLPEALIEADGTEVNYSIPAGQSRSFARDCDDLQAIFINDAEMQIAPGISPEADTDAYREPDDFTCGDTITFNFNESNGGVGLEIEFENPN
jgi:hypothetical protein